MRMLPSFSIHSFQLSLLCSLDFSLHLCTFLNLTFRNSFMIQFALGNFNFLHQHQAASDKLCTFEFTIHSFISLYSAEDSLSFICAWPVGSKPKDLLE